MHFHRFKTVHNTGIHEYKECSCGKRKIIRHSGGYQPVNTEWLNGGKLKQTVIPAGKE